MWYASLTLDSSIVNVPIPVDPTTSVYDISTTDWRPMPRWRSASTMKG